MPANSFSGNRAVVRDVVAAATFLYSRSDEYAMCSQVPAGAGTTLELPPDPEAGDWYWFASVDGSCGLGNPITLQVAAPGTATVNGGATVVMTEPNGIGRAVFDAVANNWTVLFGASAGGSASGDVSMIRIPIGIRATTSSTAGIPAGAVVFDARLDVVTPYSGGTTIELGVAGTPAAFMGPADNVATVAGLYQLEQDTPVGATAPLFVTIAGGPVAGDGFALVLYAMPQT